MTRNLEGGVSRRKFLVSTGAAGAIALAGCTEGAGDDSAEQAETGTPADSNDGDSTGSSSSGSLSGEIPIAGSSTVYPLAQAVGKKFMSKHPKVNVTVQSTGSGGGFQNFFCVGKTDFNDASRPISESEKELCADNGVDFHEMEVATDALTVVVNNENDWVDCMTVDQLKQIWQPDAAETWSDIDSKWPDEEINRYGAAETSGTFDYFTEAIVGEEGSHTQDYQPTEKDNLIVQGVSGDKYAIGYFGFAYYSSSPEKVKAVAVDNGEGQCVGPSLETAKEGSYQPLSRPLYTYVSKNSLQEEHVREFARYFIEQSGNESLIADEIGYVPNTEEAVQSQLEDLEAVIDEVTA